MRRWNFDRILAAVGATAAIIAVIYVVLDHKAIGYQRGVMINRAIEGVSRGMPTIAQTRWMPTGDELAVVNKAMADLDTILDGGSNASAYNLKGILYMRRGEYDNALASFDRARRLYVRKRSSLAIVVNNIGDVWEERCEYRSAEARYRESLSIKRTSLALANLADCLLHQRRLDEARRYAKEALTLDRMSIGAHFVYAKILWQGGETKDALIEFERAIQIDSRYQPDTHLEFSRALAATGEPDRALDEASTAIDIAPSFAEAHSWYAGLLDKKGDATSAKVERQRAVSLMSMRKPGTC